MFLPSNITLKFGDSGDFVTELQRRLAMVKAFPEGSVNGFFDGVTVNAVTSFQSREGLKADGVAGPETLRRLNGVVSGESGTADSKKEDEEKAREALQATHAVMMTPDTPAPESGFLTPSPVTEPVQMAELKPAVEPIAPAHAPAPTQANEQHRLNDLAAREAMAQQQQHTPAPTQQNQLPSASDLLSSMLQQTGAQPTGAHPAQPSTREQATSKTTPPHTLPTPPQEHAVTLPETTPRQSPGIIERTRQFANAFVQKLATYFEAKLHPSVLDEVHAIGQTMARSGLKEAPIPMSPDMQPATRELPTRGPEQSTQRV